MPKKLAPSFVKLKEVIQDKYPKLPEFRIVAELRRINQITQNTRDLVDLRIMDLGSGSVESPDGPGKLARFVMKYVGPYYHLHRFDPWYCRFLNEAGAHAIGIDIGDNSEELFESHAIDLFQPDALSQFDDNSIDAVNNLCFTVPRESQRAQKGTSPHIMNNWMQGLQPTQEELESAWEFDKTIRSQVHRILKNGGIYNQAEFVFVKQDKSWKHRNTMDGLGS